MSNRSVIVLILAGAIAAAAGLWLGQRFAPPADSPPALAAGLLYPQPRVIAPFALERADGSAFGSKDLDGKWTLMFFGFTHCPDVCPTTLAAMREVEQQVTKRADGTPMPQFVFVSVDPARDRGAVMGDYAKYFSPSIIAVTGDDAALADFTTRVGVVYAKSPLEGSDYNVDHSSQLVLFDPQGRNAGIFRPPFDAARIADDLAALGKGAKP